MARRRVPGRALILASTTWRPGRPEGSSCSRGTAFGCPTLISHFAPTLSSRETGCSTTFFWDYAVDFMTTAGRQRMVDDADRCRDLFVRFERATIRMLHEVGAAVGLTPERIQK